MSSLVPAQPTTTTVEPEAWARQAERMSYPEQVAFYRRGCLANGIDVSEGVFLLGVETCSPFDMVDLELTEGRIEQADQTCTRWLEKLRLLMLSCPNPTTCEDWPGYVQSPVPLDVPRRWGGDDDESEAT